MNEEDLKMLEDFSNHSSESCPSKFRRYDEGDAKLSDEIKLLIDGPQKWRY